MPAKRLWSFASVFLIPALAHAGGDVGYQLEVQVTASNVDSESLTRDSIALQDRTWSTPGVEQSTCHLAQQRLSILQVEPRRFRFDGDGPTGWMTSVFL